MSDDASFSKHISHVCSKAKQKWILTTFNFRQISFMKFMFKSQVQGHIDYCYQLYMPGQSKDLEAIEDLQKVFSTKIPEVNHLNYCGNASSIWKCSPSRGKPRDIGLFTLGRFWKAWYQTVESTQHTVKEDEGSILFLYPGGSEGSKH